MVGGAGVHVPRWVKCRRAGRDVVGETCILLLGVVVVAIITGPCRVAELVADLAWHPRTIGVGVPPVVAALVTAGWLAIGAVACSRVTAA